MISKLKAECGSQFTQHLEGMFKDIDLSREIMQSFRQTFDDEALTKGIEMNVNVITQGCWPSYPVIDVNIPEQLAVLQEKFQDFYLGKALWATVDVAKLTRPLRAEGAIR